MNKTIDVIVSRLKAASAAYYETGSPIMLDDEYDALLEDLRTLAPDHAYFQAVGAPVSAGAVRLPVPMPSLRKVKPDSVGAWTTSYRDPWIASDKLDGISALWVPSCGGLYLRGDGLVGQDVSHLVGLGIQGLAKAKTKDLMIRGELIVPKGSVEAGAAARNWVNGVLHQKQPSAADVSRIQFISYSVYSKKPMTRHTQIAWLEASGYKVVPWCVVGEIAELGPLLERRRAESPYEIDGLVLGQLNGVPEPLDGKAGLPRDSVAFKMPLADQRAYSEVMAVHWASSMGGLWIPRVEIKPVKIGAAMITYATGHNARFIHENSIGPGAIISVRRSGDVIPTIEGVAVPADEPAMPLEAWDWDERGTHAVDKRGVVDADKKSLHMVDELRAFDVDGVSSKNALKLVEAGLDDLVALVGASQADLVKAVGTALGAKLYEQLRTKIAAASPERWIGAYQGWPRGFGKLRAAALLALGPVESWPNLVAPPRGLGVEAFREITACVGAFCAWRQRVLPTAAPVSKTTGGVPVSKTTGGAPAKGAFCMTGFRDSTLAAELIAAGWELHDTVKKTTTVLIVVDEAKMGTTKVAAAREKGVRIILRKDVSQLK
jgi:DNA ligase (NAD+)